MNSEEIVKNTKNMILTEWLNELREIKTVNEKDIAVYGIIRESINANIPHDDVKNFELIKYLDNCDNIRFGDMEEYNLSEFLLTLNLECFRKSITYDVFFMDLIERIFLRKINYDEAIELIEKIEKYKNDNDMGDVKYIDNERQIYIPFSFDFDAKDFENSRFPKKRVIGDHDSIKIFTSNFNQNAIVVKKVNKNLMRVYLIEKDPDLDIREFFKCDLKKDGKIIKKFSSKNHVICKINRIAEKILDI